VGCDVTAHAAGNGRQVYVDPPTGPPSLISQYCVPCVQKRGPHENVPSGALHPPPLVSMSWPAAAAIHGLV
jgi:hypothetical protein